MMRARSSTPNTNHKKAGGCREQAWGQKRGYCGCTKADVLDSLCAIRRVVKLVGFCLESAAPPAQRSSPQLGTNSPFIPIQILFMKRFR